VELGEAPLGIVYASDATASSGITIVGTFPETAHRPIVYPAALTRDARAEAEAFLDRLESPEAESVFLANGFRPL
jgi:molybdate transport system substrate-binding protein